MQQKIGITQNNAVIAFASESWMKGYITIRPNCKVNYLELDLTGICCTSYTKEAEVRRFA